ncbi:hypothetical protein [Singulisphaera acidiphila]|uniref:Uncharacterized protein n=1 Tax=Singulisphaera acidiphila (strain ATCC BAA-1392 / DSM 18658 / VKM B-2454 / MOB10) TaxID=886293 RepID=L0DEQ0_SINAD|nr:hypothetical protein [Singulisphaera acidiphila]AGA27737.1 hypothetical protein Sinac_3480 [Singulisphaera acidiphila DSM 18658]
MIRTLRLGLLLALVGFLAAELGPSARGQVLDDEVEEESHSQMPGIGQPFMIAEANFDHVVFGNARNSATALARLETLVKLKIDEVDQVARLTDAQKKKLELASRGDIKRFFDQVEEKRKAFQLVRNDQQKYAAFYQQLNPLRQAFSQGLFGEDSIFTKTLKKSLDEGQIVEYGNLGRQRRALSQEARIGRVLAILDHSVGLDVAQRRKLMKLIIEETRPPKIFGNYDIYAVLFQLSRLPQDRIKPIFQEPQWRLVHAQLEGAKKYEKILISQGAFPLGPDAERWIVAVDPEAPKPVPNDQER